MPCNLNFNQCNSFRNFPRPIFNCYQNFLALLNQSGTTIINPVVESSSIISDATAQTILQNSNVLSNTAFSQGSAIFYNNLGAYTLVNGRYMINYNINATIASNGLSSYGIYLNGVLLPSSLSSVSGTASTSATHSGSSFVEITAPTGEITIRNANSTSQVLNSGNISITKII